MRNYRIFHTFQKEQEMRQWIYSYNRRIVGHLIACSESPITSHGPAAKVLSDPPSAGVVV